MEENIAISDLAKCTGKSKKEINRLILSKKLEFLDIKADVQYDSNGKITIILNNADAPGISKLLNHLLSNECPYMYILRIYHTGSNKTNLEITLPVDTTKKE